MKTRMWEWWRKVEEDYREKRRREDEQRERERRERARRTRAWELQEEARGRPVPTMEELLEYMEREWGVAVEWEEGGMQRPRPMEVQVEVEIGEERARQNEERRLQKSCDEFGRRALMLVLTGRFGRR